MQSNQTYPARSPSPWAIHAWFLTPIYLTAILWGVRSIYPSQPSSLDRLLPVSMALTLAWWAIADARTRGHPIPLLSQYWFLLASSLAIPGYVLWSRGWRGLGLLLLYAIAWFTLAATTAFMGHIALLILHEFTRAG